MLTQTQGIWENHTEDPVALTFTVNELLSLRPEGNRLSDWGTNHLLLYLQILRDLQKKTLRPEQVITFSRGAMVERSAARSTGGIEGEERLLIDVLNQAVSLNAPDCIRALCQLYGGEKETRKVLNRLAIQLNISKKSQRSLTGRLADTQKSNLFDYYKIGLEFLRLNRSLLSYIKNRIHVVHGKIYQPQSLLDLKGDAVASIFWGQNSDHCLIFHDLENKQACSLVINGKNYIGATELAWTSYFSEKKILSEIELQNPVINILADTYFGEYYTKIRQKQGRDDALQRHGYSYSFDKIAAKMLAEEFNVITYEGVLTKPEEVCYNEHKVFYLGGDKDKTIRELKNRHINLVSLGNNHAKDYGEDALLDTLDSLQDNGIETFGAGKNINGASNPIILKYSDKKIAFFSGYWYQRGRDLEFDFYATSRPGVTALDGTLLNNIHKFKRENPETIIVVFAHWGVDFADVSKRQRQLATRLVLAGADLIFGSGPHKIQPIEKINGKLVFYSLGNGVFNSDGWDLVKPGNLPYGYFIKWDIANEQIKVYPFIAYNQATFWQPLLIEKDESEMVIADIAKIQDLETIDSQLYFDDEGYLYYTIPFVIQEEVQLVASNDFSNCKQWFDENLKGEFLNPQLTPNFEFDFMTIEPNRLKEAACDNAVFVALSPIDLKSMIHSPGWEPKHRNEELIESFSENKLGLIISDTPIEQYRDDIPQYIVENSLEAASLLADCMTEAYSGKLISITGSVGKSSLRMLLEQMFAKDKIITHRENVNLHLAHLDIALVAMSQPKYILAEAALGGVNHLAYGNETYRYRSDIVIMTSFGTAHSSWGVERNLKRKIELFRHAKNGAIAVINGDIEEQYLWKIKKEAQSQNLNIKTYSFIDKNSDCYLIKKDVARNITRITISLNGKKLQFPIAADSDGQIQNIMACLLVLDSLGHTVRDYIPLLEKYHNLPRNLERVIVGSEENNFTIIDDTHNSSMLALKNGIKVFSELSPFYKGKGILVVGEVADLEDGGLKEHYALKSLIQGCQADHIFLYGNAFKQLADELPNILWFSNKEDIAEKVRKYIVKDSLVFIKGSSASKFYTVADQLKQVVI